ncbi:MAG TPA: toprim domain-containing protein [Candidatus Paceibacterota bacterium]|nr:toprim domain-containing protein [Candidatus Paceibacterota bacterium]
MQDHIEQLTKLFLKFPGIGARQAKRFAYFILSQQDSYVKNLSTSLLSAKASAQTCPKCFRIFEGSSSQTSGVCYLCSDEKREKDKVLVVEKTSDIDVFLRTDYNGEFFVLGSLIPITQKSIIDGTNTKSLLERIKNDTNLKEIILAFPLTPNGDHTDFVLREMIGTSAKISSLGRGLSTGTELEYADPASLEASLKKRE